MRINITSSEVQYEMMNRLARKGNSQTYRILKRTLDIVVSALLLLMLTPLFIVTAAFIKLDGGCVFFKQQRVGKNGKLFTMYKFRSMKMNAEAELEKLLAHNEIEGHMFKMKNDPRITKIGAFIRKTSIDELPQFINVLKGEMSLVGPRPALAREVEAYTDHHKRRLFATPGCSGLWQVSGRNKLSFEQMVELDIHYIKNESIQQDVRIIAKTAHLCLTSILKIVAKKNVEEFEGY